MNFKLRFLLLSLLAVSIALIIIIGQSKPRRKSLEKLKNFNYTIIPSDCNESFIVWMVTSYSGDASPRSASRRAYPTEELNILGIKRIFLLGLLNEETKKPTITQIALTNEAFLYNDILQGNFIEAYRNLTYKHLMGLKWVNDNCKTTRYLVKTDDDIIVNLYELTSVLINRPVQNNVILGYVMKNTIPVREPANKWFTDEREFPYKIYPDYVSGWLYVTRLKTVERLIQESEFYDRYFWIDDIFLTGILTERLKIELSNMNELFATDYRYLDCCIEGGRKNLKCDYVVGPNGGNNELQVRFQKFAKYCYEACSPRDENNSIGKTCVAVYETKESQTGRARVDEMTIK